MKGFSIVVMSLLLACTTVFAEEEKEEEIPISEVPLVVVDAVKMVKKGIRITEAEKIYKKSGMLYDIEGRVGRQIYEVMVTPEGKVLKVARDD